MDEKKTVEIESVEVVKWHKRNYTTMTLVRYGLMLLLVTLGAAIVTIGAVSFSRSGVKEEKSIQTYEIIFESMTEKIVDDAEALVTQYSVTGQEGEIRVLNDFRSGTHVIKVPDQKTGERCYVTTLDSVPYRDISTQSIQVIDEEKDVSLDEDSIRLETVVFNADYAPINDLSELGPTGRRLCDGINTYKMRRNFDIFAEDDLSDDESDMRSFTIRTYVIRHVRTETTHQESLLSRPASSVFIDNDGLRVRRDEMAVIKTDQTSLEYDVKDITMQSQSFRIWDFFGRRRQRVQRDANAAQTDNNGRLTVISVYRKYRVLSTLLRTARPPKPRSRRQVSLHDSLPATERPPKLAMAANFRMLDRYTRRRQRRSASRERQLVFSTSNSQQLQQQESLQQETESRALGGNFRMSGRYMRGRG